MQITHVHLQLPHTRPKARKRKRHSDRNEPEPDEDVIHAQHQFEQELRQAGMLDQLPMAFGGTKPTKTRKKHIEKVCKIPIVEGGVDPLLISHVQGELLSA